MNLPTATRPSFKEAENAWAQFLKQKGLPTTLIWVFDENLCFERKPAASDGFQLGYQTTFTPTPSDAAQMAFEYFRDFDAPLVFYRIGSSRGSSVCILLCDKWFENKSETDGFAWRQEWRMAFRAGTPEEIEEITDKERWLKRLLRDRPLHDLDFCMTLNGIREIVAHDRVLSAYERYALKFLHAWRRLIGRER